MKKENTIGFKLTPQRLAILSYLDGNKDHPSAEDIYKVISKVFPTMSLATVYNTLDLLKERGGISELTIDPDKKRFDPNTEHHHHLICVRCRRIMDVHTDLDFSLPLNNTGGFEITGTHIEFYGVCPECKKVRATHS